MSESFNTHFTIEVTQSRSSSSSINAIINNPTIIRITAINLVRKLPFLSNKMPKNIAPAVRTILSRVFYLTTSEIKNVKKRMMANFGKIISLKKC